MTIFQARPSPSCEDAAGGIPKRAGARKPRGAQKDKIGKSPGPRREIAPTKLVASIPIIDPRCGSRRQAAHGQRSGGSRRRKRGERTGNYARCTFAGGLTRMPTLRKRSGGCGIRPREGARVEEAIGTSRSCAREVDETDDLPGGWGWIPRKRPDVRGAVGCTRIGKTVACGVRRGEKDKEARRPARWVGGGIVGGAGRLLESTTHRHTGTQGRWRLGKVRGPGVSGPTPAGHGDFDSGRAVREAKGARWSSAGQGRQRARSGGKALVHQMMLSALR